MMRKLNMLVMKKISADNAESVCYQEVLLPGHLYTMVMKGEDARVVSERQVRHRA